MYTEEEKWYIFNKTQGKCRYCGKQLSFENWGKREEKGSWQIDHSTARARGGQDHLNNLFPACIDCNLKKSDASARSFREQMKPARMERRNKSIERELGGVSIPVVSFLALGLWRIFDWWRGTKQNETVDGNSVDQNPRRISLADLPWDGLIILAVVALVVIAIFRRHRSS
jgi:hypothetical protein